MKFVWFIEGLENLNQKLGFVWFIEGVENGGKEGMRGNRNQRLEIVKI
jgi:hypothetical protein